MKTKWARFLFALFVTLAVIFVTAYAYRVFRDTADANISITTPEFVAIDDLYALMRREGKFAQPFSLQGEGATARIEFPLEGNNLIRITAEGRVIQVSTTKENWWKDIGLRRLTRQWTNILDSSLRDHQPLLEDVAKEIRRITGGR